MPVITTDSHTDFAVALDLIGSATTIIAPLVTIAADDFFAVRALLANTTLINHGAVLAPANDALIFPSSGGLIINASDGTITGFQGIAFQANDSAINFGSIWATFVGVGIGGTAALDNHGLIYSALYGVEDGSSGGTTTNSGTIEGLKYGFVVDLGSPGQFTTVVNSGVLQGGVDAIGQFSPQPGGLHLQNSGMLIGGIDISGSSGADIIVNAGHINGAVKLGTGNDSFNGTGGTSGPIDGGLGENTITGGLGSNQFVFDTALGPTNFDLITNFHHHIDKIDLSQSIFTAVGPIGALKAGSFFEGKPGHEHAATRIIYNPANGSLSYDADGRAHAHAPIHFATLSAHLNLASLDFVVVT